jgi:hypothetical protein
MKITSILTAAALATVAITGLASASKADVQWTVSGTFDDGGSLSGQFTINVYGYLENNFSLTTTSGSLLPGFVYNSSDSYYSNGIFYVDFQPGYTADLHLLFTNSLLVASKNNPIIGGAGGPSYECQGSYSCYLPSGGDTRYFTSGAASAVPELSTWAMMLLGFAGLGFAGYYRANRRNCGVLSA